MNLSLLFSEKMYLSFATLFLNHPAVGYAMLYCGCVRGAGAGETGTRGSVQGRPA